jgi:hypothetical protein
LICRKIAILKFIVFVFQWKKPDGAHFISSQKTSSVPGRRHTAVVRSSGAPNPRVPVLKLIVVSLSPTLAGRDLTWCRLKSHMAEELLDAAKPRRFLLAKVGPLSNRAGWQTLRGTSSDASRRLIVHFGIVATAPRVDRARRRLYFPISPASSTMQMLVSLTETSSPANWSMLRFSF